MSQVSTYLMLWRMLVSTIQGWLPAPVRRRGMASWALATLVAVVVFVGGALIYIFVSPSSHVHASSYP